MDTQIGRVARSARANGLADNTIVIFTSDNGGERFADTWPFTRPARPSCSKAACACRRSSRWPAALPQGRTTEQVAISMDWLPTLLAAAGAAPDPAYPPDGMNLLPVLDRSGAPVAATAVLALQGERAAGDARRRLQVPEDPRQHLPVQRGRRPDGARQPEGAPRRLSSSGWRRSGSPGTRRCCRRCQRATRAGTTRTVGRIIIGLRTTTEPDNPR